MAEATRMAPAEPLKAGQRLEVIDLLRGLVIALMALDHTRDYFHQSSYAFDPLDSAHTTILLYITRWVTHFCAPTFVFLAGVSAYLQSVKGKVRAQLSRFLLTRGLWLIFLEITVVSFGWEFAFGVVFLQVIWAIGCSMIALALVIWLPRSFVLALGILIIAGHNAFDGVKPNAFGAFGPIWTVLHQVGAVRMAGVQVLDGYPILPWIGVMFFGYGLGGLFLLQRETRNRKLVAYGLVMIAAFLALRLFNHYGDTGTWTVHADTRSTLMDFFNVQKYPPSLLYVLVTLGSIFVLIPFIERLKGVPARVLLAFGAVPLFTYVVHIYLVHALALIASVATGHGVAPQIHFVAKTFFDRDALAGTGYPLWVVYMAWIGVLAILYPISAWWAGVKKRRRDWWLSYM